MFSFAPPHQQSVNSHDGYALNVWDYGGSGPVLLMCHCTGGVARSWDVVIQHLAGGYRVIAYDTRGHGDSETLPDKAACAWRLSGQDVHTVLDALEITEPVYAIGHSAGATHIAYAEDMTPGRFKKVMLMDAIIGPAFVFQGENPLAEISRRRRNLFESLENARERFAEKLPKNRWVSGALEAYLQYGMRVLDDGQAELKLSGEHEAWFYEQGGSSDLFEKLDTLQFEALLITGSESNVAPLTQFQSEKLPNARLEVIEGASHFIPQEKPASVAAWIAAFLV